MTQPYAHGGTPVPPPDPLAEATLFDIELPPPVSLSDKFGVPPFSVLDRRAGYWTDRKRRWLALGMASEIGRDETLTYAKGRGTDEVSQKLAAMNGGTSIFDPVLCELAYRWFSAVGDTVLDPFSGGSVRGVTAGVLGRQYVGVDIRAEQVEANRAQTHLVGSDGVTPSWLEGDATRLANTVPNDEFDFVFTCPPYGDLEVYSDHPRDISTWTYDEFLEGQQEAIMGATERLRADRFACWVTSDIRDKKGAYRGLVHETARQFRAVGLTLHNEVILVDPVGTSAIRAERPFRANRKITRAHQVLLVFCKGDPKRAANRLEPIDEVPADSSAEGLVG